MGIDQGESRRRRKVDKPARKKPTEGFFRFENRIVDSVAYADLGFASRALLVQLGRQFNGRNNGHLQATFALMQRYGFGSEHTVSTAVKDLIVHGFLYRTRSHGANKQWAKYALTWLPIHDPSGLFLETYVPKAFQLWERKEQC